MKIFYSLFLTALIGLLFTGNSSGPAAVQGLDRTGSPVSPGPCQVCHSSGAFSPTFTLELLQNNEVVTEYVPGEDHLLRVTIETAVSPEAYGFQAVALKDSDDSNAGAFIDPPNGVQVTPLNGRQYAEHSTPNEENVFEITWTAPESGTGDVNFHASVVAANLNGSSGGDGSVFLNNPVVLSEGTVSNSTSTALRISKLQLSPNPVQGVLTVDLESRDERQLLLKVSDANGRGLIEKRIGLVSGNNREQLGVEQLSPGIYFLQVTDGRSISTHKFIKIP